MSEIRLDLIVSSKKKTFTQDFVPYSKALEYTEQESELFESKGEGNAPTTKELAIFRANFVASLFEDPELTGAIILDGLDTENKDLIMDIIMYRVLGYEKTKNDVVADPKDREKA